MFKEKIITAIELIKTHKINFIFFTVVFSIIFTFCAYFSQFGIILQDEGYYLSSAYGLYLGNELFTSELQSGGMRNFDFFLSKLFFIFPHLSVFDLRILASLAYAVTAGFLYLVLRKCKLEVIPALTSATITMLLWIVLYRAFCFSYISLPVIFTIIATYFIILLNGQKKVSYLLYAGIIILLSIALISRVTFIASLVLFTAMSIFINKKIFKTALIILGGCSLVLGLFYLSHWLNTSEMINSFNTLRTDAPGYSFPELGFKMKSLYLYFSEFSFLDYNLSTQALFLFPCFYCIILGASFFLKRKIIFSYLLFFADIFFLVLLYLITRNFADIYDFIKVFNIFIWLAAGNLLLLYLFNFIFKKKKIINEAWLICIIIGLAVLLQILFSAINVLIGTLFFGLIILVVILALIFSLNKFFEFKNRYLSSIKNLILVLILGVYIVTCGKYISSTSYSDSPRSSLNTKFTNNKIGPIYSTPDRVLEIENLIKYVNLYAQKGDYILAYNEIPLIYFLTSTRPSVNTVWSSRWLWTESVMDSGFIYMCAHQSFPKIIVQYALAPMHNQEVNKVHGRDEYFFRDKDLLSTYVQDNYFEANAIGNYTFLLPKPEIDNKAYCDNFKLNN